MDIDTIHMNTFHPIDGFDGYFINKNGEILSKKKCKTGRLIKPGINETHGYYCVGLRNKDKKPKFLLVHRLLALTFIPNPENLPHVDHHDRIRTNNKLENLRWVTHATNMQNATRPKTNKLGHKHIYPCVSGNKKSYRFEISRNGTRCNRKRHSKRFKKLEDAIKYRDEYLTELGEEIID